jgi:hypothetical protein
LESTSQFTVLALNKPSSLTFLLLLFLFLFLLLLHHYLLLL